MFKSKVEQMTDIFKWRHVSKEIILFRYIPHLFMHLMDKYFRLEVYGIENIPKKGRALICPNHSGFSGFDAMLLSHEIFKHKHRVPRTLTHHLWFATEFTTSSANKLGYIEATAENGERELKKNHIVILFPEGENGNFKPTNKAYQLQRFKSGMVRMALSSNAPIVPTLIIGAEETHINLKKIKFGRDLSLPLPFNILPFPIKWKMIFLPPIDLTEFKKHQKDRVWIREKTEEIQNLMQNNLNQILKQRSSVYQYIPKLVDKIIQK